MKTIAKFIIYSVKYFACLPFCVPTLIFCLFLKKKTKVKLVQDAKAFEHVLHPRHNWNLLRMYALFVDYREFRSVVYMRIGRLSCLCRCFMPGQLALTFSGIDSDHIGGGIFIQHGHSTRIGAESIGNNCWINQNVTIGYRGDYKPMIGDNVRIGTGAVVIGRVVIGNNVKIGANATVVKSVPDNCTVVSPAAFICVRDGEKVC